LIGNKSDLQKVVPTERIEKLSKKYNAPHYQISCKNNIGVTTVWEHIVAYLYKSRSFKDRQPKKEK
jgi:predicted GTPase